MARFNSAVTGVDNSQMERCESTSLRPLVNPPEILSLGLEFVQSKEHWIIRSKIYQFRRLYGTRFETFAGHLREFLEALTSSVNTCMMDLVIGDVLMQQKMTFHEQFGGATSSC